MSGSSVADSESEKQQGTELKLTRKQEGTEILKAAGCGEVHISSKLHGHKTHSTTFTELDKTETAKKDFKKRWNQN